MASYQKRGKTWQYTVSNKGDPIRKSGFRTKAEAKAEATEVESQLNNGTYVKRNDVIFDEYFINWVNTYKKHLEENTLALYDHTHKKIIEYFKGKLLQEITKSDYQIFLNKYGKNRSKETVRKTNTHIRSCVKDAIDEGIIRTDFTRNAIITGKAGMKKEDKYLNYKDSQNLLRLIYKRLNRTHTYYLLLLAMMTGMRFSEIIALTRRDFDFESNTINVEKTWGHTKKMHKGWGPTKNGEERIIKNDNKTMDTFKKWFESTPDNDLGLIFYSEISKYKVISNASVNKLLKSLLTELGLSEITIHGLRHTHVSILLYRGVSIYYISKRIGHVNIDTTLNVYTHLITELEEKEERKTLKVLETILV